MSKINFSNGPTSQFPKTQYSIIPLFQHSNYERSELSTTYTGEDIDPIVKETLSVSPEATAYMTKLKNRFIKYESGFRDCGTSITVQVKRIEWNTSEEDVVWS